MKKTNLSQHYICQGCKQPFGGSKVPRLLPLCGHTLCQDCIQRLMEDTENGGVVLKCLADGKTLEFQDRQLSNFPKNFAMLRTIEKRQNKPQKTQKTKTEQLEIPAEKVQQPQRLKTQQSNPPPALPPKHSNSNQKPQSPSKPSKRQPVQKPLDLSRQQQTCLIHSRPLQIVCLKDSVMICSNCALFGEHRNHMFKSFADMKKDINLKETEFISVIDEKEQMESILNQVMGSKEISSMLLAKKQSLIKQIQEYFDKTIKRLKHQQKKLYLRLEEITGIMEKSFENDAERIKRGFEGFREWERRALDCLNILEGEDISSKLIVLDYDKLRADPIDQGFGIIDEIQKQRDETIAHWNSLLNRFRFDTKPEETDRFISAITLDAPAEEQDAAQDSVSRSQNKTVEIKSVQLSKSYLHLQKPDTPEVRNFCINDDLLIQMEQNLPNNFNIPQLDFDTSLNADYNMGQLQDISKIEPRDSSFYAQTSPFAPQTFTVPKSPSSVARNIQRGIEGKKKPKTVKVPPKYQKTMQCLVNDTLEVLDFTNSELGNQDVSSILQHLKNKKVKTVKLIRCKLTDDILPELWGSMGKVISLNLSQNSFSDRIIDSFLDNVYRLPCLKTLTLSQNKINLRNVKFRIEEARKYDVTITL